MTMPVEVEQLVAPRRARRRRRLAAGLAAGAAALGLVVTATSLWPGGDRRAIRAQSGGSAAPLPADMQAPPGDVLADPGAAVPSTAVSAGPAPTGTKLLPPRGTGPGTARGTAPSTAVTTPAVPGVPSPPVTVPPGTVTPPDPLAQPSGAIVVRPSVDRNHYGENEGVILSADVCNAAAQPVQFYLYPGQEVLFYVRDPGGTRIDSRLGQALGGGQWVVWAPLQCRHYASQQRWWHDGWGEQAPYGFGVAAAGKYRIEGQFQGQPPKRPEEMSRLDGTTGLSDPFDLDGVTVVFSADKSHYGAGDTVRLTARVCNPTSRTQVQTFRWSPRQDVRVMVPDYSRSTATLSPNEGPSPAYEQTWDPGACVEIPYAWNQGDRLVEGSDAGALTGTRRGPGPFSVEVLWYGRSRADDTSDPGFIVYRFDNLFSLD
ncbi:MAG: hypothetical protein QOJ23_2015 [Actinomycetota bacterium]|nr:hypothetical protein [Actinomycetota bacterium]